MADWGIGSSLKGLYGATDKNEQAKQEIGTLYALKQQMRQDSLDKEQAALRAQESDAKISEFAMTLLGPDRERINKKARILSQKVREQVNVYGGDYRKFLENGGHQVLKDYQNSVMSSEESSVFLENKKNMENILRVQQSGKGHLLTPTDMRNMESYNEKGEGRITYSGMMNEIEMPKADNYDYGTKIPAKDILFQNGNYMKILGNYTLAYPDAGTPSDLDLMNFVENNYQGKGTDWQRNYTIQKEKNHHEEQLAETQAGLLKEAMKAAAKTGNTKTYTDADGNTVEIDNTTGEVKRPDQKTLKGTGGATRLLPTEIMRAVAATPKNLTASQYAEGAWMKNPNMVMFEKLSRATSPKGIAALNLELSEEGLLFDATRDKGAKKGGLMYNVAGLYNNYFAPSAARSFFAENQADVVKSLYGFTDKQIDLGNKKLIGWQPNEDSFLTDGTQAKDNPDVIDFADYKGDWKIIDIVNVGVGKNAETQGDSIVMDIIKTGGKFQSDKEKSKKAQDATFAGSEIEQRMAIALENEEGVRFYQVFNPSDPASMQRINTGLGEKANLQPLEEDNYNRSNERAVDKSTQKKQIQDVNNLWDTMEGNVKLFAPLRSEIIQHSATGQFDGQRTNFFKGFYVAATQSAYGSAVKPNDVGEVIQDPDFSLSAEINEYKAQGLPIDKWVKDYKFSNKQIVQGIINWSRTNKPEDLPMLQLWLDNISVLDRRNTK